MLWGRRRVVRSLPRVLQELELLASTHGVSHVHLEDDTFLAPRSRVEAFCQQLQARLPDLTWVLFNTREFMFVE